MCSKDELRSPVSPSPEMTGDPFGSSESGHTAASDSRGHRDRQQTRQLRKDLTLLFSIINEQQSKQIRTESGWGLPECCCGAERSKLGLTTKWCTPIDLLNCDSAELGSAFCIEKCHFKWKGAQAYCASIEGSGVHLYVGGIMRAESALPVYTEVQWCLLNNCPGEHFTVLVSSDDKSIRIM